VALLLAAFIAEFTTPAPRSQMNWWLLVASTAFVDMLLITLVTTPDRLRTIVAVVAASIGFHAAKQGAIFLLIPGHKILDGVGGAFGDNNSYAVVCAMVGLLLLAMGRSGRSRWERLGFIGLGWLTLLAVIATYSRGGFLAAAAGLLVYSLLRGVRVRWLLGAVVVGGVLWTFMPAPDGYTDRIKTIGTYQDDESAAGRLYFWSVALIMSADQPLGVGIQNFNVAYDQYDASGGSAFGKSRSVHNSHLQVLTEAGMLGFVIWLFMLFYAIVLGLRVRRRGRSPGCSNGVLYTSLAEGLTAAMVAFIVGGTFTAIAWSDFVWCVLAIVAALDRVSLAEVSSPAEAQTTPAEAALATTGLRAWTRSFAGS
jgi:putative inorganic carbon (HCO3(-)) transporter